MPDDNGTDTDDSQGQQDQGQNVAQLRTAHDSQKSRADRLEAFMDAGITTSSPLGKIFFQGYDGELSADKITEAAKQVGLLADPTAATGGNGNGGQGDQQQQGDQGQAQQQANGGQQAADVDTSMTDMRRDAAGGAQGDQQVTPDPRETAKTTGQDVLKRTGSRDKAMAAAFGELAHAAASGDQRPLVGTWHDDRARERGLIG